jgi:hypothetical protein
LENEEAKVEQIVEQVVVKEEIVEEQEEISS